MKCPKCCHQWKLVKRKPDGPNVNILATGEIHAGQFCYKCETRIDGGYAYAVDDFPAVVCAECMAPGEVWLPDELTSSRHTLILSRVVGLLAGAYDRALEAERQVSVA